MIDGRTRIPAYSESEVARGRRLGSAAAAARVGVSGSAVGVTRVRSSAAVRQASAARRAPAGLIRARPAHAAGHCHCGRLAATVPSDGTVYAAGPRGRAGLAPRRRIRTRRGSDRSPSAARRALGRNDAPGGAEAGRAARKCGFPAVTYTGRYLT
eukprot:676028-Hanusia_phi.AAC.1